MIRIRIRKVKIQSMSLNRLTEQWEEEQEDQGTGEDERRPPAAPLSVSVNPSLLEGGRRCSVLIAICGPVAHAWAKAALGPGGIIVSHSSASTPWTCLTFAHGAVTVATEEGAHAAYDSALSLLQAQRPERLIVLSTFPPQRRGLHPGVFSLGHVHTLCAIPTLSPPETLTDSRASHLFSCAAVLGLMGACGAIVVSHIDTPSGAPGTAEGLEKGLRSIAPAEVILPAKELSIAYRKNRLFDKISSREMSAMFL